MIDWPVRMSRPSTTALAIAAVVLLGVSLAIALAFSAASALAPTALSPPQWKTLEHKMGQLQLNSERFSVVSRGLLTSTDETNGKPVGRSKSVSLDAVELGEASLTPAEGEVFLGSRRTPGLIAIGSTVYERELNGRRSQHRRPWVRSGNADESPAERILPFVGGGPYEVDAGGTGSFAGLINLMATAEGSVGVDGPVLVQGQPTTEFTATVEPRFLIKHLTVEEVAQFKTEAPIQQLQIFVTEAGLPIRVVTTTRTRRFYQASTTEILAVNVPVMIKAPPASETISIATLRKREQQRKRRAKRK